MKAQCLIIDDEPLAITLIESYIAKFPNLEVVATCSNAMEGFAVVKSKQVDLIFLDIQMPLLTGLEFLKILKNPPSVIFTTAYREYAIESYDLDVVDYLLKPISFDRFFRSIEKYFASSGGRAASLPVPSEIEPQQDFIFVNVNKKYHKILFSEILYVESIKDYIRIHTVGANFVTKDKISEFSAQLPNRFLRIHRSFIVNTDKITAYTSHDIELGELEIPIGSSYKRQVIEHLR